MSEKELARPATIQLAIEALERRKWEVINGNSRTAYGSSARECEARIAHLKGLLTLHPENANV